MQIYKICLCMILVFGVCLANILLGVRNGNAQDPPDVAKILFESDRKVKKNKDIYIMNADGTDVERITDHAKADISPTWSPDGHPVRHGSGAGRFVGAYPRSERA